MSYCLGLDFVVGLLGEDILPCLSSGGAKGGGDGAGEDGCLGLLGEDILPCLSSGGARGSGDGAGEFGSGILSGCQDFPQSE